MAEDRTLEALKEALRRLPGVGPKSAQRMALHLLERDREALRRIAATLTTAADRIRHCNRCNNFCEGPLCAVCLSTRRDESLLCVVETPSDLISIEQSGAFNGRYYVLMGRLSPLDGIGPEELGISKLESMLASGTVKEVVLATNPTVEGEATAHYISDLVHAHGVRATRIASGVPVGGELEYTDRGTLARALTGRRDT